MTELDKRALLVSKEINRLMEYVRFNDLFQIKNRNFINNFINKKQINEHQKEEELTGEWLFDYFQFLGEYYANSLHYIYSENFKKKFIKLSEKLNEYNNSSLVQKIPSEITEILNYNYSEEEIKKIELTNKEEYISLSESDNFHSFIAFLTGKQIGCINRSLSLSIYKKKDQKMYSEAFFLICEETLKLIDFITYSDYKQMMANFNDFYKIENNIIKNRKKEIHSKGIHNADLVNGYYNFYEIQNRLLEEEEKNKKDR